MRRCHSKHRQRGNALVEMALGLPLLVGSALLIGDLYNISLARAHLEQTANSIASVLAVQNRLDEDGLQALIEQAAAAGILGDYELLISRVETDRSMPWRTLRRGSAEGLCPEYSESGRYSGELPEERPANTTDEDLQNASMIVVQLCRNSDNLALSGDLLQDKDMQSIAFARLMTGNIELDEPLQREVALEQED